jgi:hypothetical protein
VKVDLLDSLITLGLVGAEQGALAARIVGDNVGPLEKLAIVGVDTTPLLPVVSSLSGIALCPPMLLACPIAAPLPPEKLTQLRALRVCVLRQEANAPLDVVVDNPDTRAQVKEILGPFFRAWLVSYDEQRRLLERVSPAAPAPAPAPAPVPAPAPMPMPPSLSPPPGPPASSTAMPAPAASSPQLAAIDNAELGAFVESAPRPKLSAEATARAMAEKVDLDEQTKREILELDAMIDASPPYALLGIPKNASTDDVKERYYVLSRRFHPDAYFRKNLGTFRARVNRVFKALKAASDKLVNDAEARDHLDLGAASGEAQAPAYQPPELELSGGSRPVPQPAIVKAQPPPPTRPTPARPFQPEKPPPQKERHAGVGMRQVLEDEAALDRPSPELQPILRGQTALEGMPVARTATDAPPPRAAKEPGTGPIPVPPAAAKEPATGPIPVLRASKEPPTGPLPRTGPVRRPPTSPARARRAALPFIIAAGALVLVIVAVVVVVLARSAKPDTSVADVSARQSQLLTMAKSQLASGFFAEAIATASQAIDLAPASPTAVDARVVRGVAYLDGGDKEIGVADLKSALASLPANDPERARAEAALAKETHHE